MTVLIVGANGFVGKALSSALRGGGIDVNLWTSRSGKHIDPDTGRLAPSLSVPEGTDCIVYLAQFPNWHQTRPDISHFLNVNVISAAAIAELGVQAGVSRFIYASTGNVYAHSAAPLKEDAPLDRDSWYALSKIHAEECLELLNRDIDICVLRLFGVYGPGQIGRLVPGLIKRVQEGTEITIARNKVESDDLDGLKISLCYLDDVVGVFEKVISSGGPRYVNVAADRPSSIRQIAECIGEKLDREPLFRVTDQYRDGDLIADVSTLVEHFDPQFTSLEEGIERTLDCSDGPSMGE